MMRGAGVGVTMERLSKLDQMNSIAIVSLLGSKSPSNLRFSFIL